MRIVSVFGVLVLLTGCSVVMAARQPEKRTITIVIGKTTRPEVIQALGAPLSTVRDVQGWTTDTFHFRQGYSTWVRGGRAVGHGIADVLTFGLWEIVGTPIEIAASGTPTTVVVTYDEEERVISAQVIEK